MEAQLTMLGVVPTRPNADIDAAAAHLVNGRHDLCERSRMAERHGGHERPEADGCRLTREAGQDGPGVGRWFVCRTGEAAVVVRPEEPLETKPFRQQRDLELFRIAEPLLGLGHPRER